MIIFLHFKLLFILIGNKNCKFKQQDSHPDRAEVCFKRDSTAMTLAVPLTAFFTLGNGFNAGLGFFRL